MSEHGFGVLLLKLHATFWVLSGDFNKRALQSPMLEHQQKKKKTRTQAFNTEMNHAFVIRQVYLISTQTFTSGSSQKHRLVKHRKEMKKSTPGRQQGEGTAAHFNGCRSNIDHPTTESH